MLQKMVPKITTGHNKSPNIILWQSDNSGKVCASGN